MFAYEIVMPGLKAAEVQSGLNATGVHNRCEDNSLLNVCILPTAYWLLPTGHCPPRP